MTWWLALLGTAWLLTGLLTGPGQTAGLDAPLNFVVIYTDDLRHDALGCTGSAYAKTPAIDRLAREGVLFRNAFVCTPLCSPSRASFLTGLHAHSHRVINNDKQGLDVASHRLFTFPRILRERARYETAFIGKFHMGFDDSRRPGFDHWISCKGQGQFIDPVVNHNGQRLQLDGYMTDHLNTWSVEFVEKERSRPFCLFLSHKAVHAPFLPAPRHESLYSDVPYTVPPTSPEDLAGKPALTRNIPEVARPWRAVKDATPERGESPRGRPRDRASVVRDQMRCLASIDEGVGQIYAALERRGLLETTVVLFTSDNGYLLGEHGEFQQKRWAYEECLRVPLVIRFPQAFSYRGERLQAVLSIDVAPTFLDLAGVEWPEPLHGRSIVPILERSQAPWRDSFLAEHFLEEIVPRVPDWLCVRTERWKYIRYPTLAGMDELYDLTSDPRELRNLIATEAGRDALPRLRAELERLVRESP